MRSRGQVTILHAKGRVYITLPKPRRPWHLFGVRYTTLVLTTAEAVQMRNLLGAAISASMRSAR